MRIRAARRLSSIGLSLTLLAAVGSSCTSSSSGPSPVPQNETFTGTLQPQGIDFKTVTVTFPSAPTTFSVVINSLTTVANSTPVTGVTVGIGFGLVNQGTCAVQLFDPATPIGAEREVPGGVDAGTYCVRLSDCPPLSSSCTSLLTEPVTYSMTIKHF